MRIRGIGLDRMIPTGTAFSMHAPPFSRITNSPLVRYMGRDILADMSPRPTGEPVHRPAMTTDIAGIYNISIGLISMANQRDMQALLNSSRFPIRLFARFLAAALLLYEYGRAVCVGTRKWQSGSDRCV